FAQPGEQFGVRGDGDALRLNGDRGYLVTFGRHALHHIANIVGDGQLARGVDVHGHRDGTGGTAQQRLRDFLAAVIDQCKARGGDIGGLAIGDVHIDVGGGDGAHHAGGAADDDFLWVEAADVVPHGVRVAAG